MRSRRLTKSMHDVSKAFRPGLEELESRLVLAVSGVTAAGAFQLTDITPPAWTWSSAQANFRPKAAGTAPVGTALRATAEVTFELEPGEQAQMQIGPITLARNLFFKHTGTFRATELAATGVRYTARLDPQGNNAVRNVVFAPGTFRTTLTAARDYYAALHRGILADLGSGEIQMSVGARAGGGAGGVRGLPAPAGIVYGPVAAAPRADAPAYAGLRIYTVDFDGTSFQVNAFNNSGYNLSLASSTEIGDDAPFGAGVSFVDQFTDGSTTAGTVTDAGNIWAMRDATSTFSIGCSCFVDTAFMLPL